MNLDDYIMPVPEEKSFWRQLIEQPLMPPGENADFYLEQARLQEAMDRFIFAPSLVDERGKFTRKYTADEILRVDDQVAMTFQLPAADTPNRNGVAFEFKGELAEKMLEEFESRKKVPVSFEHKVELKNNEP